MSEEQTLFKGSSSPMIIVGTLVLCVLVATGGFVGGFLVPAPYSFILFGVGVLALVVAVFRWLLIKVRVYEVTSERIRLSTGILTRRTDEMELYRVKDVTLIEPFFMRMLSLGDIELTTHDLTTPLLRLEAIPGARNLREELRKSIETCRERKRVRLAELE